MRSLATIFLSLSTLLSPIASSPTLSQSAWSRITSLLAFGDSYTYVQGTDGLQNFSFIGSALNFSYTPSQLLSDRIVQNQIGTSAGGPNWVEYLSGCFSGLPADCTAKGQKQLWDFAFAGADISANFLPLHHNYSVDLDSQVQQWDQFARPVIKVDVEKNLVLVWIGINDISDSATNASIASFPAFYSTIIDTLFSSLAPLPLASHTSFLFLNLPPLDRTPGNVVAAAAGKPVSPNVTQINSFNSLLEQGAQDFEAEWRGKGKEVSVKTFDANTFLNGVLDHPAEFGIKNSTDFCPNFDAPDIATNFAAYGCIPISEYFWYNTGHITFTVHRLVAGAVASFLEAEL